MHDGKDIEQLLPKIIEAVVQEVDPEQIYLFGSRARGEARDDSDLDLLVIERGSFGQGRSRFNEINRIYGVLSRFRIPEDILVYSTDEFNKWRGSINHIIGRCYREGKLLYARH